MASFAFYGTATGTLVAFNLIVVLITLENISLSETFTYRSSYVTGPMLILLLTNTSREQNKISEVNIDVPTYILFLC